MDVMNLIVLEFYKKICLHKKCTTEERVATEPHCGRYLQRTFRKRCILHSFKADIKSWRAGDP